MKVVRTQGALDRLLNSFDRFTRYSITEEPPRPLSTREKKVRLDDLRRRYTRGL